MQPGGSRFPSACGGGDGGAVARSAPAPSRGAGPRTTLTSAPDAALVVLLGSGAVLVVVGHPRRHRSIQRRERRQHATDDHQHDPAAAASTGPQGFPVTDVKVPKSGEHHSTFAIPKAFQTLLPRTQAVYLTLAEQQVARQGDQDRPSAAGQPILRGGGQDGVHRHRRRRERSKGDHPDRRSTGQQGHLRAPAPPPSLASANQPFFDVRLTGVKPAPKGSAYIVWFVLAVETEPPP